MLEKRRYDIDLGIERENLVFIYSIPSRDFIVHFFFSKSEAERLHREPLSPL